MDDPRIPPTDPDSAPFFAGCREGVLRSSSARKPAG
jgi:hypothetical protein